MFVPNARLKAVKQQLNRLRAFRRAEGNTAVYVRAAVTPVVTYGAKVMGLADARLQDLGPREPRLRRLKRLARTPTLSFTHWMLAAVLWSPLLLAHLYLGMRLVGGLCGMRLAGYS